MRIVFVILILLFNASSNASVSSLVSSVDRNPITEDESVTLIVTANGEIDSEQPDFSVLNNDFRYSAPAVSRSTQIINGARSSSVTWRLTLLPKRAGTFIIPEFEVAGIKSDAVGLRVMPAGADTGQPREFFITTDLSSDEIYLQQQLVYTVKIFIAGEIQSGSLSEPELAGAIIEKLGEDKEYQELIDGVRYRVIERNFALIPQSSGEYVVNSPVFEARVLSRQGQSFAYFNRTRTITRIGPEQPVSVKAIPANYQYTWLPSEQVQLNDEWQGDIKNILAGDPITRTITLTALGLTEEQLPDIQFTYPPSFKTYPEQPQRATVKQDDKLISQMVLNTAIIAEAPGRFILPEVSVPWFNVNTGKTEFAKLPAKAINILENPTAISVSPPVSLSQDQQTISTPVNNTPIVGDSADARLFDWLHLVLLAIVFALSGALITIINSNKRSSAKAPTKIQSEVDEQSAWVELQTCLKKGDISHLPANITGWVSLMLNSKVTSVHQSLELVGERQVQETYNKLIAARYSANAADTEETQQLLSQLQDIRAKFRQHLDKHQTSLYPQ